MNNETKELKPGDRRLELDRKFKYPIVSISSNHDYIVWLSVQYAEVVSEYLNYSFKQESFTRSFDYAIKFEVNTLFLYLVSKFIHFDAAISEVFTELDHRLIHPLIDKDDGLPEAVWIRFIGTTLRPLG